MKTYCTNFSRLIPGAAALLCTATVALGQTHFSTSGHTGQASSGVDAASCGGTLVTQNTDPNTVTAGASVSCNDQVSNTDNFYARSFAIAQPIFLKCVDFGIETNAGGATNVRVRLYTSPTAVPNVSTLSLIAGSEIQVPVPDATNLAFVSATYPGGGITVPAGNLVVELFTPSRQTASGGDGGIIFVGCNSAGQSGPTYLYAPDCGLTNYQTTDSIGFPGSQLVMRLGTFAADPCMVPLPSCRADVVGPSNGPPDGVVNVADLLSVIGTWGQTQVPPGSGPRPKGDCDPLPNGNCLVNVGDLLAVIGGWGTCPCEARACCFPNGSCQLLCQAPCATAGGNWQSAGSNCAPNLCVAVPANDECAGAVTVNNGANNLNNTGATNSTGLPGGACITGGAANIHEDIWAKYTATCTGPLTIDLCATTGTVTDTALVVYTGACGSLVEKACNDDSCSLLSSVTFNAVSGTQYYIRVGSWNTSPTGAMVLTINCQPANNDFCDQATDIAVGGSASADLQTSTADNAPTCDVSSPPGNHGGRWFTVTSPTNQTLTATTCSTANPNFAVYDPRLDVYCGPSCASLFCVGHSNNNGCGSFIPVYDTVSWCAAANQTYWILVSTDDSDTLGEPITVSITGNGTACTAAPCGPPNDLCANAIDITANIGGAAINGTNVGATPLNATSGGDPELPAGSPSCQWAGEPQAVYATLWYKFTAPASGRVNISLCANTGTMNDSSMALYSGSCGALTEVACGEDECGAPTYWSSINATGLTPGATYRLMIGSSGEVAGGGVEVPGTFNFTITEPPPPTCPPTLPSTGCTGQIGGNGTFDGVNGTRPSAGWLGGALGVMEDIVACNAGGETINQIKVAFIDQTASGTGTLSTYNTIRVSIYSLSGGAISALPPCTATPLFTHDFVVGTDATKSIVGSAFSSDVELWTCTVPGWHVAQGNYGVYFSFPQLNAASPSNTTFIATGPTGNGTNGNDSSPQNVFIWGNSTPTATCTPVNSNAAQHSAFCAGGTIP